VNLAQIRSAVPGDVSYTNKKTHTDGTKNRTFRSSLRAVTMKATFGCFVQSLASKPDQDYLNNFWAHTGHMAQCTTTVPLARCSVLMFGG